jgi:hypothetical protein
MKLSVITITARQNPRLGEAARCLFASFVRAHEANPDLTLEWIIVDELDRDATDLLHPFIPGETLGDIFRVGVVAPPATPYRSGPDKAVAHNTARNCGLAHASGDYVVFLNDCNMVTRDWVRCAHEIAAANYGWRCHTTTMVDLKVPDDGVIAQGCHDTFHVVPPATVAGACWGAPMASLVKIGGFDLAYDGQRKGNDVDAIVRMSRTGLTFVTTKRAHTLQLKRTKIEAEISTRKDVYAGTRNIKLLADLQRDKTRILPLVPDPQLGPGGHHEKAWDNIGGPVAPRAARGDNHAAPGALIEDELTDDDRLEDLSS